MSVDLAAKFAKDEREFDGLPAIEKDLVQEAMDGTPRRHLVVMEIEVTAVTVNVKDGTRTPRVRAMAVEVLDGEDAIAARQMLDRTFRRRTGRPDAPPASLFDPPGPEGEGTPAERPEGMARYDSGGELPAAEAWPGDADFVAPPDGEQAAADADSTDAPPARTSRRRK